MVCVRKWVLLLLCLALLTPAAFAEEPSESGAPPEAIPASLEKTREKNLPIPGGISEEPPLREGPAWETPPAPEESAFSEFPAMEWRVSNPVVTLNGKAFAPDLAANLRLSPENGALNAQFELLLAGERLFPLRAAIGPDEFLFSREDASRSAAVPLDLLETALGVKNLASLPAYLQALLEYDRIYWQPDVRDYLDQQMGQELWEALPMERLPDGTYELDGQELAAEVYAATLDREDALSLLQVLFKTNNPLYAAWVESQNAAANLIGTPEMLERARELLEALDVCSWNLTRYVGAEEDFEAIEGQFSLEIEGESLEFFLTSVERAGAWRLELTMAPLYGQGLTATIVGELEAGGVREEARVVLYPDKSLSLSSPSSFDVYVEIALDSFAGLPDEGGVSRFEERLSLSVALSDYVFSESEEIRFSLGVAGTSSASRGARDVEAALDLELSGLEKQFGLRANLSGSIGGELSVEGPRGNPVMAATWEEALGALGARANGLFAMDQAILRENRDISELGEAFLYLDGEAPLPEDEAPALEDEVPAESGGMSLEALAEAMGGISPLPEALGAFQFQGAEMFGAFPNYILLADYQSPEGTLSVGARRGGLEAFRLGEGGALAPSAEGLCLLTPISASGGQYKSASYLRGDWLYTINAWETLSREEFAGILQDLDAHLQ